MKYNIKKIIMCLIVMFILFGGIKVLAYETESISNPNNYQFPYIEGLNITGSTDMESPKPSWDIVHDGGGSYMKGTTSSDGISYYNTYANFAKLWVTDKNLAGYYYIDFGASNAGKTVSVLYRNIGTYYGKSIGMKITISNVINAKNPGADFNQSIILIGRNPFEIGFFHQNISAANYYIEFVDADGVSVSSDFYLSFSSINNTEGIAFNNDTVSKLYLPSDTQLSKTSKGGWTYLGSNSSGTFEDWFGSSTFYKRAATIRYKNNVGLSVATTTNNIWFTLRPIAFGKVEEAPPIPAPVKREKDNKNKVSVNDTITYEIVQQVNKPSSGNYKSFRVVDNIQKELEILDYYVMVGNREKTNLEKWDSVDKSDKNNTVTFDFYNYLSQLKTDTYYYFYIECKVSKKPENYEIRNQAVTYINNVNLKSNEVIISVDKCGMSNTNEKKCSSEAAGTSNNEDSEKPVICNGKSNFTKNNCTTMSFGDSCDSKVIVTTNESEKGEAYFNPGNLKMIIGQGFDFKITYEYQYTLSKIFNYDVWTDYYKATFNDSLWGESKRAELIKIRNDYLSEAMNYKNNNADLNIEPIANLTLDYKFNNKSKVNNYSFSVTETSKKINFVASEESKHNLEGKNVFDYQVVVTYKYSLIPSRTFLNHLGEISSVSSKNAIDGGNKFYTDLKTDPGVYNFSIEISNIDKNKDQNLKITNNLCTVDLSESDFKYRIIDVDNPFVNDKKLSEFDNWKNGVYNFVQITNKYKKNNSALYSIVLSKSDIEAIKNDNTLNSNAYLGICDPDDKQTGIINRICRDIYKKY